MQWKSQLCIWRDKVIKMLIDVSEKNNVPKEIEGLIFGYFEQLPKEIIAAIKSRKVNYEVDVRIAIEDYLNPFASSSYDLYDKLRNVLYRHELVCYHSTRVLEKSFITDNGLKTNSWDSYSENMRNTYFKIGMEKEKIEEAISLIENEYNRKYSRTGRKAQVCFFSGTSLLQTDSSAGYEQFCENLGGELARWALKEKRLDLYDCLRCNGKAYIVKFKLPFKNIPEHNVDSIIYQFISYYAAKYFFDYNYEIEFDGTSSVDIPKEDILEMIPYTIDRYYFNE